MTNATQTTRPALTIGTKIRFRTGRETHNGTIVNATVDGLCFAVNVGGPVVTVSARKVLGVAK